MPLRAQAQRRCDPAQAAAANDGAHERSETRCEALGQVLERHARAEGEVLCESDGLMEQLEGALADGPEFGCHDLGNGPLQVPVPLAVELDRAIVGFCLVMHSDSSYDSVNYRWFTERYDDFMYLDRVAFDTTAQGRGLGTLLYAEVDRLMVDAGESHLALEVNVDPPNEPSLAFHAHRGFVEVGQQDTPYGIRVSMQMRQTSPQP